MTKARVAKKRTKRGSGVGPVEAFVDAATRWGIEGAAGRFGSANRIHRELVAALKAVIAAGKPAIARVVALQGHSNPAVASWATTFALPYSQLAVARLKRKAALPDAFEDQVLLQEWQAGRLEFAWSHPRPLVSAEVKRFTKEALAWAALCHSRRLSDANHQYDAVRAALYDVLLAGPSAVQHMVPLLAHRDSAVAGWAAIFLLQFLPRRALPVIRRLENEGEAPGLHLDTVLSEWRRTRRAFNWAPVKPSPSRPALVTADTSVSAPSNAEALLEAGGVHHAKALAALARPSWHVTATQALMRSIPLGASRFGGVPDVPRGFVWPTYQGTRLQFLAQFNLGSTSVGALPSRGWLLFFYDVNQPWGFEPSDAGAARVVFVGAGRHPVLRTRRKLDDAPFAPCMLSLTKGVELPHEWDSLVSKGPHAVPQPKWSAYANVRAKLSGAQDDERCHHLLGHPQLVQDDMRESCALVSQGVSLGDEVVLSSAQTRAMAQGSSEWELLLQLDSDESGPGWVWGQFGRLYFWIRRVDLKRRRFERTWAILQSS